MKCNVARFLALAMVLPGVFALAQQTPPDGASTVEDMDLPLRYGVGLTYHHQSQPYRVVSARITLDGEAVPLESGSLAVENEVSEVNLKVDAWILPFLNVFGLIGKIEGTTTIPLGKLPELDEGGDEGPDGGGDRAPLPGVIPLGDLAGLNLPDQMVEYNGTVFGGGVTLAAGTKHMFGSLTATYTDTSLDLTDSSVRAWVVTPKVGARMAGPGRIRHTAVWIGAMYQDTQESHRGGTSIPSIGAVTFDVELSQEEAWNVVAGAAMEITKTLNFELEAGIGSREQITASAVARF